MIKNGLQANREKIDEIFAKASGDGVNLKFSEFAFFMKKKKKTY